jgi:hypothetical protein
MEGVRADTQVCPYWLYLQRQAFCASPSLDEFREIGFMNAKSTVS